MGTQPNIAHTILERKADYVLAVKDNQTLLAESIRDFFEQFCAALSERTPHSFYESLEKDHGRIERRRCYVFDQLECLHKPQRWPGLRSFSVIDSERTIKGKTTCMRRYYISSLPPEAERMAKTARAHWSIENRLHWCMDVAFGDDQMLTAYPIRRAQHGVAKTHHHEPDSPRSRSPQRRDQDTTTDRRIFRPVPRSPVQYEISIHAIALMVVAEQ